MALTAAPLEPGVFQFFDNEGVPLAPTGPTQIATLYTFVPGGSTPKATWQDATQTTVNANPIQLDAAGRCVMFGSGQYRLQLFDQLGNLLWDNLGAAADLNTIAASLPPFVGDTGSGGTAGQVPAPPPGSAAAGDYLSADGSFQPLLVPDPAAGIQPTQAGRMFPQTRLMLTSDTLGIADAGGEVTNNSSTAPTLTIPTDATAGWFLEVVTQVLINSIPGATAVSIVPATGVGLYWPGSSAVSGTRTLAPNGTAVLSRIGPDSWNIVGAGIS